MREEKFTKGPWEIKVLFADKRPYFAVYKDDVWICTTQSIVEGRSKGFDEENEANANLIAAAPEMYELLSNLSSYVFSYFMDDKRVDNIPYKLSSLLVDCDKLLKKVSAKDE